MKQKNQTIVKIVSAIIRTVMLVMSCIYLRALPRYILLGAIIVFASLGVLITNTDSKKFESAFKILLVTLAVCSLVLVCFVALEQTGLLEKMQDADALIGMIRSTRHWGVIVFILFIIVEIICLPV